MQVVCPDIASAGVHLPATDCTMTGMRRLQAQAGRAVRALRLDALVTIILHLDSLVSKGRWQGDASTGAFLACKLLFFLLPILLRGCIRDIHSGAGGRALSGGLS